MTPEVTIEINRSGNLPILIRPKGGVLTGAAIDLTGSAITLRIVDVLGVELLEIAGTIEAGTVRFDLDYAQRATLPAGLTCRYEIHRMIAGRNEPWPSGPLRITGAAVND